MSDGVEVDATEMRELAASLDRAAYGLAGFISTALKVTAMRIKRGSAAKIRARRRWRGGARAIDFEFSRFAGFGASVIQVDIGYNKAKGGAIGSLIEFGAPGATNAVAPGNELARTLKEEEPDFIRGIEKAVDDSLRKENL